jgi:hypothetical protein
MSVTCVCFGYLRDQYERDADFILDGIETDHAKAAQEEDADKNSISAVFCLKEMDEIELKKAAFSYANGRPLPILRSAQRWRFAMRLRFAAALLRPLDKGYIPRSSKFYKRIAGVSQADLTQWLLTDGMWFCCETFNEVVFTSERFTSLPHRPPWKPDLEIKKRADKSEKLEKLT